MDVKKRIREHCKKIDNAKQRKKELYEAKEWYTCRALLGNQ